jgi:hypothetical protein
MLSIKHLKRKRGQEDEESFSRNKDSIVSRHSTMPVLVVVLVPEVKSLSLRLDSLASIKLDRAC